jgi:hypothetical protein
MLPAGFIHWQAPQLVVMCLQSLEEIGDEAQ